MKIKIRWTDLLAVVGLSIAVAVLMWVFLSGYSL